MRHCKYRQGFTLMEMLIVVAIIAVLVAIAIPVFADTLERSREAACMANRRSLTSELVYARVLEQLSDAEVMAMAAADDITCPVTHEHYTCTVNGNNITVICALHQADENRAGAYGMGVGVAGFNLSYGLDLARANVSTADRIDSTATDSTDADNPTRTQQIKKYFADNGYDLDGNDIKSWAIVKSNSSTSYYYWSQTDVLQCSVGDRVLVMRYNTNKKTYTVGYLNVEEHTNTATDDTYLAMQTMIDKKADAPGIWTQYAVPGQDVWEGVDKTNFDQVKAVFDEASK